MSRVIRETNWNNVYNTVIVRKEICFKYVCSTRLKANPAYLSIQNGYTKADSLNTHNVYHCKL